MAKRSDLVTAIGTSGLKLTGGRIYEEFLPKLSGDKAVKVYDEMARNSSVVGTMMFAITSMIKQTPWHIEPSDPHDQEAIDAAVFVEECLYDMSHTWNEFLTEALTCLVHGWSFFEIVYKVRAGASDDKSKSSQYDDKRIGWRKMAPRAQDTRWEWVYGADGELEAMVQMDNYAGKSAVTIPLDKAVHFRVGATKDNPEGWSLLRSAVVDWYFVKKLNEIEAIGIERDLTGLPTMQVPAEMLSDTASAGDKALLTSLEKMLGQLKQDERGFLILPSEVDTEGKQTGYKFALQTSGGSKQVNTNEVIARHEQRMAMCVLMQFIFLGMQDVGSRSLSSSSTSFFSSALGSILDDVAETYSKQAIEPLCEINGMDMAKCPYLAHGDIESPELDKLASFLSSLAGSGILGSGSPIEKKLLEMASLPVPELDDGAGTLDEIGETEEPGTEPENEEPASPPAPTAPISTEEPS
jgi:hypothetical protein